MRHETSDFSLSLLFLKSTHKLVVFKPSSHTLASYKFRLHLQICHRIFSLELVSLFPLLCIEIEMLVDSEDKC